MRLLIHIIFLWCITSKTPFQHFLAQFSNFVFQKCHFGQNWRFLFSEMCTFDKIGVYTSGDAYNPFNTFSEKNGLYTSCDVYRAICQTLYWDYARHVNIVFRKMWYIHHMMYIRVYTSHSYLATGNFFFIAICVNFEKHNLQIFII